MIRNNWMELILKMDLKSYEKGQNKYLFRNELIGFLCNKNHQYKKQTEWTLYDYIKSFFVKDKHFDFETFISDMMDGRIDVDDWWYLFPYLNEEYFSIIINSKYMDYQSLRCSFLIQLVNTLYDHIRIMTTYQMNYMLRNKFELYQLLMKKTIYKRYRVDELFLKYLQKYIDERECVRVLCKKFGSASSDGDEGIIPNVKMLKFLDEYVKCPEKFDETIGKDFVEYLCENKTFEEELLQNYNNSS